MSAVDFVGRPLATLLLARMRTEGLNVARLAVRLQVGRSYLSQLLRGVKPISAMDDEILRACADYLELPLVLAYVLAGKLVFGDFLDKASDLEVQLRLAIQQISESPIAMATGVGVSMLEDLPLPVSQLLVALYERAEQVSLLPRVSLNQLYVLSRPDPLFELRLNKTS